MLDFILKYWIEVLFSGVVAMAGILLKHTWKLQKESFKHREDDLYKKIEDMSDKNKEDILNGIAIQKEKELEIDAKLQSQISEVSTELSIVKQGLLCIQGFQFKRECRALLEENREITLREWEEITAEHTIYNSLGGNHDGDSLYATVKIKYESQLMK